jgi:putative ABC transport system substrate-binding protein
MNFGFAMLRRRSAQVLDFGLWRRTMQKTLWNKSLSRNNLKSTTCTELCGSTKNRKWLGLVAIGVTFAMCGAAAQAQHAAKVPRVGLLRPQRADDTGVQPLITAFRQGLRELGYVEGQNIVLDIRWAEGKRDRLPDLANELARLKVDVIVTGGQTATRAAKKAAGTIPIVMTSVSDPVRAGFVESLARPGGNITGLSDVGRDLAGKRLELLKEAVPRAARMAVLWNPSNPGQMSTFKEVEATAGALGLTLRSLPVNNPDEFENAFAVAAKDRVNALLVSGDALLNSHRSRVVELVVKSRLPAMYTRPNPCQRVG